MSIYDEVSFPTPKLVGLKKKILENRAKGILSFSYGGQSFSYSSPKEMMKVAYEIARELNRREAKDLGLLPVGNTVPFVRRPLSEGHWS